MRKTKILISLLIVCALFALGARSRYGPAFWRAVSGGIEYVKGNVTITDGDLTLSSGDVAISGALNYGADAGGNDTYVVTITGIAEYAAGMFVTFDPNTDNTGACTLNINSLGAKALKTVLGADPGDSHIDADQIVPLVYDGTNFVILTPDSNP